MSFTISSLNYLQGNWTVCVPLKFLTLMSDIQEAKCFEFTVQILPPPPLGAPRGEGGKKSGEDVTDLGFPRNSQFSCATVAWFCTKLTFFAQNSASFSYLYETSFAQNYLLIQNK